MIFCVSCVIILQTNYVIVWSNIISTPPERINCPFLSRRVYVVRKRPIFSMKMALPWLSDFAMWQSRPASVCYETDNVVMSYHSSRSIDNTHNSGSLKLWWVLFNNKYTRELKLHAEDNFRFVGCAYDGLGLTTCIPDRKPRRGV